MRTTRLGYSALTGSGTGGISPGKMAAMPDGVIPKSRKTSAVKPS